MKARRGTPAVMLSGERARFTADPAEALKGVVSWEIASPLERALFIQRMHGMAYSRRLVLIAWNWFRLGFVEAGFERDRKKKRKRPSLHERVVFSENPFEQ